jgi:malate synthase
LSLANFRYSAKIADFFLDIRSEIPILIFTHSEYSLKVKVLMVSKGVTMGKEDIKITGHLTPEFESILTPDALAFTAGLHRAFNSRRLELLRRRDERQAEINSGTMPDFLPETAAIRKSEWGVAPIPPDLQDRRVEITGPVDRKMVINALNSGANVYMADFEDAHSPRPGRPPSKARSTCATPSPDDHLHQPRRQVLQAE